MIIYKIENKVNGKVYIGCTTQLLKRRWLQHCNSKLKKTALKSAIIKYGVSSFEVSVIEECDSVENMFLREMFWVKEYNSSKKGYNMTLGGDRGPVLKGKDNPNFGKPNPRWAEIGKARRGTKLPQYHIDAIIKANVGIIRTQDQKNNMSNIKKAAWSNGIYNNIGSKISASKKGKPSANKISIICMNNHTVYNSYGEAAKALGVSAGNIPQVVNGKYSHTKGFIFQKLSEEHLIF